jgi:hypothetical protein
VGSKKLTFYLPPEVVELEVAAGVAKLLYRFINAFGSDMGVYAGSCWVAAIVVARCAVAGDVVVPPFVAASSAFAVAAGFEVEPVDVGLVIVPSVWLIEISWSNWFSETIWPTIAVGSTGEVGSWFCSSVTSRFRNVVCRLLDEVAEALSVLEPLELFVVARGATAFDAICGAATLGVNPCMFICLPLSFLKFEISPMP